MALVAVEAMPAGSKPLATVGVRISKRDRHYSGAAVPFSTETSSLQERARCSAFTLNVVEVVGPYWTRFVDKLSSCIA